MILCGLEGSVSISVRSLGSEIDKCIEISFVEGYLYGLGDGSAEPFGKAC